MNNVKEALTRKFGPLPAWAWLGIVAFGLWIYRRGGISPALSAGTGSASTSATSPGADATNGSLRDPITLGPGESVYDPNTGQLIGTAPEQSGEGANTTTGDTGGTAPGDIATGGNSAAPTVTKNKTQPTPGFHKGHGFGHQFFLPGVGWVSKAKYLAGTRKNKRTNKKGKAAPTPTTGKSRNRSTSKLVGGVRKKTTAKPPKGRERGRSGSAAKPAPRTRAHKVGTHPVTRQHAAAPKAVHPMTQKVQKNPEHVAQHTTTKRPARRRKK